MGKLVVWLFPQSEKLEITIWFLSSVKWNEKCERRLASADGAEEWKHKFPLPLVLSLCPPLWRGEWRVGSSCCFTCSFKWCYKLHWRHGVNHNQQSPFAGEREREWEKWERERERSHCVSKRVLTCSQHGHEHFYLLHSHEHEHEHKAKLVIAIALSLPLSSPCCVV